MKNEFKVRGTIGSYASNGIVIVEEAGTERPVMLEAYKPMMTYIDAQSSSDMEEKYMDIDFVYTSWCNLIAIIVPSTNPHRPAKVIIENPEGVRIFGEQSIIDTTDPEPMSPEAWDKAIEYAQNNRCFSFDLWKINRQ